MNTVYLNGQFIPADQATISPLDRGFLFADGVYEVIPVYHGKPFRLTEHLDRLQYSLSEVSIENPYSHEQWSVIIQQLIDKNNGGHQGLYLQVTRGSCAIRSHEHPEDISTTVFAMCSAIPAPMQKAPENPKTYKAITLEDIRWHRCDIKSVSLLPNTLMKQQAKEAGADEALLLRDGKLTEGSSSNVFIISNNQLLTPAKSHFILGGITRDLVIELCKKHDITLLETDITEQQLLQAEEIWVCSSTREIIPVTELNGQPVGTGKIGNHWHQIIELYLDYKQELIG